MKKLLATLALAGEDADAAEDAVLQAGGKP